MKDNTIKDNLLIVQVCAMANTGVGDYIYRISQPAEAMGKIPGVIVVNLTSISPYLKEMCFCADVLVLHLMSEQDLLPIISERKRKGLATVYEISDNFMAFPSWVEIKSWFEDPINLATTFQLIQLSDAIQGVSEILIDKFSFLHSKRQVFGNQIMTIGPKPGAVGEDVIIGWGGSIGHTEDLKLIAPVIQDIYQRYSHVRFAFMGNRNQYEEIFGSMANSRFFYREPGNLFDYYDFLEGLDIGLAPLTETPYNICRSDVKFIEYASRGVVPVVSDVGPYKKHTRHRDNAFRYESLESLKNILEMLINNRPLIQSIKKNAYNYVKMERMEEDHASERISFYEELAEPRSNRPLPKHLLEHTSKDSKVYHIRQTIAEKKIIEGAYAESEGYFDEARSLWLEASRHLPGYSFPLFCIGRSLMHEEPTKAIDHFRQSLLINPDSLRTRLFLGRTLKKVNTEMALKEFERALQVFPDFAPAWREIGLLEKEKGHRDEACKLLDNALKSNPFYTAAASDLGKLYFDQGNKNSALEAFQVAADLLHDNLDYQIDVIETLIELGKVDAATNECLKYLKKHPHSSEMYDMLTKILISQGKEQEAILAHEMASRYKY